MVGAGVQQCQRHAQELSPAGQYVRVHRTQASLHLGVSPERGQSAASVEGADTGLTEQKPELVEKERAVSRRAEGLHKQVCGGADGGH